MKAAMCCTQVRYAAADGVAWNRRPIAAALDRNSESPQGEHSGLQQVQ